MNTENMVKIRKYKEELEQNLTLLEKERQAIIEKLNSGEMLSSKEMERNQELVKLIKEAKADLELFEPLNEFDEMSKDLAFISKTKPRKAEKEEKIQNLLQHFTKINNDLLIALKKHTKLDDKDVQDLEQLKNTLLNEIQNLTTTIEVLQKRSVDTKDIETELSTKKDYVQLVQNCQQNLLDLNKVEEDLRKLAKSNTDKDEKTVIMITYNTIINEHRENYLTKLEKVLSLEEKKVEVQEKKETPTTEETVKTEDKKETPKKEKVEEEPEYLDADFEEIENNEDKKSLKERTKEKLNQVSEFLKTNGKKIAKIGTAVILCVGIVVAAKSCSKNIENSKENEDIDNKTTIEQTYEDADRNTINALTEKGYNEYSAVLMAKNFDKDTIEALTTIPYNQAVEIYATVPEFNIDYLNDYENARTVYEITADKAVDYVNRSIKIIETNFYTEATINDVVEIVMAIDNKELFTQNNANLAQSFNTSFNRIVDNYLFGTTTDEDIKKLDALQYFAADGTDMDLFLTEFATIAKSNIENPNDKEAKNKMYNYLATFALSLNGYTNVDDDIKVNTPYNTNAQVNDYFDWYIAYNSFIAPLYPTFVDENDFTKYEELQYLMITALEDPQFEIICGESRTLGGE